MVARHKLRRYKAMAGFVLLLSLVPMAGSAQQAPAAPSDSQTPSTPKSPIKTAQKPDARPLPDKPVDDNPFPEAQSEAAQKAATKQQNDRQTQQLNLTHDKPAETSDSPDASKAGPVSTAVVDPKLSVKDLEVGRQYYGMGNYQGAYERLKEATAANPANLDAVFYLAEAARKSAHLDESAENYKLYLDAQPEGAKAKQARKALAQLQGR